MHYYQFNIADYRKDTGHLSTVEHGIYRQLIDWYYMDEKPIPKETQVVIRRLRLVVESDNLALQNVLNDFFFLHDDGYHCPRCDSEINAYHAKADKNRENGKKGGRPKALPDNEENHLGSFGLQVDNPDQSQNNPNHKPITNNQEESLLPTKTPTASSKKGSRLPDDWVLPKAWGEWAMSERKGWSADDVRRCADRFADYWRAKAGKDAAKLDWQATWRNWVRNDKATPGAQTQSAGSSNSIFAGMI